MRVDRDINNFDPEFLPKLAMVMAALYQRGYNPFMFEGYRTVARQQFHYQKGRGKPGDIVTECDGRVKKSRHQSGRAADVIFRDFDQWGRKDKPYWPPSDDPRWKALGEEAHNSGLKWGGDWGWDFAHVEMDGD